MCLYTTHSRKEWLTPLNHRHYVFSGLAGAPATTTWKPAWPRPLSWWPPRSSQSTQGRRELLWMTSFRSIQWLPCRERLSKSQRWCMNLNCSLLFKPYWLKSSVQRQSEICRCTFITRILLFLFIASRQQQLHKPVRRGQECFLRISVQSDHTKLTSRLACLCYAYPSLLTLPDHQQRCSRCDSFWPRFPWSIDHETDPSAIPGWD